MYELVTKEALVKFLENLKTIFITGGDIATAIDDAISSAGYLRASDIVPITTAEIDALFAD